MQLLCQHDRWYFVPRRICFQLSTAPSESWWSTCVPGDCKMRRKRNIKYDNEHTNIKFFILLLLKSTKRTRSSRSALSWMLGLAATQPTSRKRHCSSWASITKISAREQHESSFCASQPSVFGKTCSEYACIMQRTASCVREWAWIKQQQKTRATKFNTRRSTNKHARML